MTEIWAKIAQQVGDSSRTDVLRSLVWPNALLLTALIWGATNKVPNFIIILLSIFLSIFMLLYGAAYILFAIKDPNMLRSERYNIQKMAIEHGLVGDDRVGLHEPAIDERAAAPVVIEQSQVDPDNRHG